ncbi:MAG: F0F1 ATP synthase subunit epsilon [Maricaulaceae bacterium]|jgi:F-type H+-transporting ATPase subunit epsilon
MTLRLIIATPTEIVLDETAAKLTAQGVGGAFGVLPRRLDLAAPLRAGVIAYLDGGGAERFVGHDEGVLVKEGETVRVAVRRAVASEDLDALKRLVREEFLQPDEHEQAARAALARLEAGIVRRFLELERQP